MARSWPNTKDQTPYLAIRRCNTREMSTRHSSNKHGGYKVFEDGKISISLDTYVPNLDIQVLRDGQATTVYSAAYHSHRHPDRLHPGMWVQHWRNSTSDHFGLTAADVNTGAAHTSLDEAAVIRDITMGIIPQRQNIQGRVPFNLMKPEQLVWVIDGVDYLETVTRRERRGTSHGVSVRVARGLYYRPSTFRSRQVEWEETVKADTGLLGLTTKHVYFAGSRKKFRVRYDRIVSFDPYDDGFGIMRDAQAAKPQAFRIGDGWFAYNLAVNLAQL